MENDRRKNTMTVHKISLMDAYLIETLRNNDISNEEIIKQVKNGSVEQWQELHEHFDFKELLKFANKDIELFQEILTQGYKVKFVTFNGLKNLLRILFGKVQDTDYDILEKGISNLTLDKEQIERVKQMLSSNWVLKETERGNNSKISIKLK